MPADKEFERCVARFASVRGAVGEQPLVYASLQAQRPYQWLQAAYKVYEARVHAERRRRHLLAAWARPQRVGGCGGYRSDDPRLNERRVCTCWWHSGSPYVGSR